MKEEITWQTTELDYPMRKMCYGNGLVVDEYIIPEKDKRDILEALYPFSPIPEMDEIFEDVWSNTEFVVGDFRVVKAEYGLKLISPTGGSVEDWWKKESEEEREFSCLVDINYDSGYRDAMEGCRYGTHKYARNPDRSADFNNGICSAYDDGFSWGIIARGCKK